MKNFILTTVGNIEVVGYEWDIKEPTAVLCIIHGAGEHARKYESIARKLNEEKIAVFALDLRGHGISGGIRGHAAKRRDIFLDLEELLAYSSERHPGCKTVLYGHSMGGNIVLDYRNRGSFNGDIDGYIASSPWIKLHKNIGKLQYIAMKSLALAVPSFKIRTRVRREDAVGHEKMAGYERDRLSHGFITVQCLTENISIANGLYSDTNYVRGCGRKRRMLLMHGDADAVCSVDGSRQIAKNQSENCQYVEWKGMAHELLSESSKEKADAVTTEIVNFIKEL